MRRVVEIVPVAAPGPPGRLQVGRVAVDQLAALERECLEKAQGASVAQLHGAVAVEALQGAAIEIDADVADRGRLAPHDGAAPKERLDVHVMGRHRRDDRLAETGRRFGTEPGSHRRSLSACPNQRMTRG